ncbi:MAG: SLBB domain-containing protein, partial [Gordonia sp. (in: high G+C Gram-positive bacteria)]
MRPSPEPERVDPESVDVDEAAVGGSEPTLGRWGITAAPRWLEPQAQWGDGRAQTDPDRFALTDLDPDESWRDEEEDDAPRHRLQPLPPAAVALVGVGIVAALIAAYFALRAPDQTVPVIDFPPSAGPTSSGAPPTTGSAAPAPSAPIVVSVVGLVHRPGLVRMPPQSRLADAVRAAGGAKRGADLLSLNLARPLRDGDQVIVGLAPAPGRAGLRSAVVGV